MVALISVAIAAVWVYVTAWFLVSLVLKRNDVADVAWGPGIFVVALIGGWFAGFSGLSLLLTVLIGVWALRLSLRIGMRNFRKSQDARYIALSESWGKWFLVRSYLQVFLLQGFLMLLVGYPALHVAFFGGEVGVLVYLGLAVWALGFFFEAVGDYQLDRFLGNPANKGKIMRYGLWKYTRHPNYFGEVTQWWGIFIMVCTVPFGWVALISPLTITWLILFVSGIPMTEKPFAENPEFQEYKKKTSPFFPWIPG